MGCRNCPLSNEDFKIAIQLHYYSLLKRNKMPSIFVTIAKLLEIATVETTVEIFHGKLSILIYNKNYVSQPY